MGWRTSSGNEDRRTRQALQLPQRQGCPPTSPFVATAEYDPHEEFKTGYLSLSKGDVVHVYWGTEAAAEASDRFPDRQYVFATRPDAATNPAERSSGWVPRDVLRAVQRT